jgi:hypothetical protein
MSTILSKLEKTTKDSFAKDLLNDKVVSFLTKDAGSTMYPKLMREIKSKAGKLGVQMPDRFTAKPVTTSPNKMLLPPLSQSRSVLLCYLRVLLLTPLRAGSRTRPRPTPSSARPSPPRSPRPLKPPPPPPPPPRPPRLPPHEAPCEWVAEAVAVCERAAGDELASDVPRRDSCQRADSEEARHARDLDGTGLGCARTISAGILSNPPDGS